MEQTPAYDLDYEAEEGVVYVESEYDGFDTVIDVPEDFDPSNDNDVLTDVYPEVISEHQAYVREEL